MGVLPDFARTGEGRVLDISRSGRFSEYLRCAREATIPLYPDEPAHRGRVGCVNIELSIPLRIGREAMKRLQVSILTLILIIAACAIAFMALRTASTSG